VLPPIAGDGLVEPPTPALRAALAAAFFEPAEPPHIHTKAVVILHGGRLIAERYAPGYGITTPILGFSMTKSVTNALVGILAQQGRLTVDAPAPLAAWQGAGDARRSITLEHLMRMDSGLALDETGSGFDPSNQMFYDEPDMAAYAQRARPVAPPGTRWAYSSASTHLVSRIVRDAVGGDAASAQRFAFNELFDPLGMRHVTLETDATGTPIGAHYMLAPARDWARFGSLYLNDGWSAADVFCPPAGPRGHRRRRSAPPTVPVGGQTGAMQKRHGTDAAWAFPPMRSSPSATSVNALQ
jgi:CubicO group peptidase (beta-lactamase class C family)